MIRLAIALFLGCSTAWAQTLPALYDVTGVAVDDTLNIRSGPTASSDIVGTLAPDATLVEVTSLSEDGRWARINTGEQSGWASLAYLTLQQDFPYLPAAPLTCYGTEPFWSLLLNTTSPIFKTPDEGTIEITYTSDAQSWNRTDRFSINGISSEGQTIITLSRQQCSDGMSDRAMGISTEVLFFNQFDEGASHYSGCCTLAN